MLNKTNTIKKFLIISLVLLSFASIAALVYAGVPPPKTSGGTWTQNSVEITISPVPRVSAPSDITLTCKDKNGKEEKVIATGGWTTPSLNVVSCGGRDYRVVCDTSVQFRCYPQVRNAPNTPWMDMLRVPPKPQGGIKVEAASAVTISG